MSRLTVEDLRRYDCALDGIGLLLEPSAETPYKILAPDVIIPRQDFAEEFSENKLDEKYWGSNRSWHEGEGQRRLNVPGISSGFRFLSSKGVDIATKGALGLLKETSRVIASSNSSPNAPLVVTATESQIYLAIGQPNIKKFAALDASDVATVSSATETSKDVLDMVSDGGQVYLALSSDGTHRTGADAATQREAFDSLTGFSVSGAGTTQAIDTSIKKEGAASYKLHTNQAAYMMGKKTISSIDLSAVTQFKIWIRANYNVIPVRIELRLGSDVGLNGQSGVAGTYFKRVLLSTVNNTVPPGGITSDTWGEDVSNRLSDWSIGSGAPVWTAITQLAVIVETAGGETNANYYFDDLRSVAPSSGFAHWSDADARILGWAKDRIYALGVKTSGTPDTWRFFEAASGAGSVEIFILPAGWQGTFITELGPYVYFGAYRGVEGVVYAYDGTNAPRIAIRLPLGDIPLSLGPFLGAGLLIGARRVEPSANAGQGVLYRAFPGANGELATEELTVLGTALDGKDYGIWCFTPFGQNIFFGWSYGDASSAGLGIYLPESGGYTRHIYAGVAGVVRDSLYFKNRRFFTVDGDGLYVEQSTYVASGQLISSVVDLNADAEKLWLAQESGFDPLPAGVAVRHEFSTDGGTTWEGLDSATTQNAIILRSARDKKSIGIQYRVTLVANAAKTATPTLRKSGIGGWPAAAGAFDPNSSSPLARHRLAVRAYPDQELRTGEQTHTYDDGWRLLHDLQRRRGQILEFQPPWWQFDLDTRRVRIAGLESQGPWGASGAEPGVRGLGGYVLLTLAEI